jgi:FkbM family methyltransferase
MRIMKHFRRLVRRLRNWFKKPESSYPRIVEVIELAPRPLSFLVHSAIEFFRTIEFGNEKEQLEVFLSYIEKWDVVYDIGASIGLHAILTACICTEGEVLTFEPDPHIRQRLEHNIHLNELRNVRVLPYAISDKDTERRLYTAGADTLSPSFYYDGEKNLTLKRITVNARMLDSIIVIDDLPIPTVLKIDIEGAEYDALKGAIKLLKGELAKSPRIIFIELHPTLLSQSGIDLKEIVNFLEACNYLKVWEVQRDEQFHQIYEKRD